MNRKAVSSAVRVRLFKASCLNFFLRRKISTSSSRFTNSTLLSRFNSTTFPTTTTTTLLSQRHYSTFKTLFTNQTVNSSYSTHLQSFALVILTVVSYHLLSKSFFNSLFTEQVQLIKSNLKSDLQKQMRKKSHPPRLANTVSQAVVDANVRVQVRTSLNESPIETLIQKIKTTQSSLQAAVYKFDNDEVYSALVDALNRGVKVQLVCDKKANNKARSHAFKLRAQGASIQFWDFNRLKKLHAKFTIVDEGYVLTGSSNWTNNAEGGNLELVLEFTGDVSEFTNLFDELWRKISEAGV